MAVAKFEAAGLGPAPYKVVGYDYRVGPLRFTDPKTGLEIQAGAPGQPMGCCKYCGAGIAHVFTVRAIDGREFEVGSDCVFKAAETSDGGFLPKDVAIARAHMREAERERRYAREEARIAAAQELLEQVRERLQAQPHPYRYEGLTLLDWVLFMFCHAGNSGRLRAAKVVEAAQAAQAAEEVHNG